jgi:hypothetical protein
MIYLALSFGSSLPFANICAFWRNIGPHQESDPNANATHVNPSVVKRKLLLNDKNILRIFLNKRVSKQTF